MNEELKKFQLEKKSIEKQVEKIILNLGGISERAYVFFPLLQTA